LHDQPPRSHVSADALSRSLSGALRLAPIVLHPDLVHVRDVILERLVESSQQDRAHLLDRLGVDLDAFGPRRLGKQLSAGCEPER
jgi:hypothetical protein